MNSRPAGFAGKFAFPASAAIVPPAIPLQCSFKSEPPAFATRAGKSRDVGITSRARDADDHSSFTAALPACSMYSSRKFTRCPAFSATCPRTSGGVV